MFQDGNSIEPHQSPNPAFQPDWRPPRALKVIAFLFILTGVLGITEMVLRLFTGTLYIDITGILALFTGRGLLRWQNGWRKCAVFLAWLFLISGALVTLLSSLNMIFGHNFGTEVRIGPWEGPEWLAPVVGMAIFGFAFWVQHVLTRPDLVWLFRNRHVAMQIGEIHELSWNPLRWRFSLASMFLATIVVAFVLVRVTSDRVWYNTRHSTISWGSEATRFHLEFGTRTRRLFEGPEELTYVVLSQGDPNQTGWGHLEAAVREVGGHGHKFISLAGQQEIPLLGRHQLYEIVDGRIHTRPERVTKEEIDAFVALQPAEWTLEALVEHAKWMRANPGK